MRRDAGMRRYEARGLDLVLAAIAILVIATMVYFRTDLPAEDELPPVIDVRAADVSAIHPCPTGYEPTDYLIVQGADFIRCTRVR